MSLFGVRTRKDRRLAQRKSLLVLTYTHMKASEKPLSRLHRTPSKIGELEGWRVEGSLNGALARMKDQDVV